MTLVPRLLRSEEATSITELAIILPVLMTLLLGIMEGGRALSAWVVLTNETREAARWGVAGVRDTSDPTLVADVSAYFTQRVSGVLSCTPLTVTPTIVAPANGLPGSLTVDAKCTLNALDPLMQSVMGNITVDSASVMRSE
jgi:Flp pilus assembly protein TadG